MEIADKELKDMEYEKMKAQLSTLKKELMLDDTARSMLASLLISIDFRIASDDLEVLQLFFKRVYVGIEALKKEVAALKLEIQNLKPRSEDELPKPDISEN